MKDTNFLMLADMFRALPPATTDWFTLDQARVSTFAEITHDPHFIHTDPARAAAETPFGGTIAHGFLTLSLLSAMSYQVTADLPMPAVSLNYGFDHIRFTAPVPTGTRVRGQFAVASVETRDGRVVVHWDVTVSAEGVDRPVLVANWITLFEGE